MVLQSEDVTAELRNENVEEVEKNMRKRETGKSKAVNPRYTLSDKMVSLVDEITEVAPHLEMRERNNK